MARYRSLGTCDRQKRSIDMRRGLPPRTQHSTPLSRAPPNKLVDRALKKAREAACCTERFGRRG